MIRFKIIGLGALCGLASCSRPVPLENNPLKEAAKALGQARAVERQLILQAEQQQRTLEAIEK